MNIKNKLIIYCAFFALSFVTFSCTDEMPLSEEIQGNNATATSDMETELEVLSEQGGLSMEEMEDDPHMKMTDKRPKTTEDSIKAYGILEELKEAIEKYKDVEVAIADGYIAFPDGGLKEVHYVNIGRSITEGWFGVNPKEPGSLLYEKQEDGSLQLVGAMFTAPADATEEELNERLPLSYVMWHLHINICTPIPIWDWTKWDDTENGQPIYGPFGTIITQAACEEVGGEFNETYFGWMGHIYPFKEDVWGGHHSGSHDE